MNAIQEIDTILDMNAIQKIDTIPVCDVSVFLIVSFSEQMFQFCCSPLYQFKKKFVFLCLSTSSSQRLFLKYSSRNFSFSLFMVKPVICAWYEVRVEVHFICRWIFSFPVPFGEKDYTFPIGLLWYIYWKSVGHLCVGPLLDSLFCSAEMLEHTVLINIALYWVLKSGGVRQLGSYERRKRRPRSVAIGTRGMMAQPKGLP